MSTDYLEPREEQYTNWKNPLAVEQRVLIHEGDNPRPFKHTWKPGEVKTLPSRYDYAIHHVVNGVIIGGLAPQLVKVGSDEKLDPALDTEAAKRKEAEAAIAAAALQQKATAQAILTAATNIAESNVAVAARPTETEAVEAEEPQTALPGTRSTRSTSR